MRRVARGDRRAFLDLYDRYAARVHGLSMRILSNSMMAEENTQDAFLKLWTRAETFNPNRGKLISWLLTVTRRLALDRIRLERRRPVAVEPSNQEESWVNLPDPATETEEARWATLKFALADLPMEQMEVIELAFYQGMSHSQIAEYLSLPLGTVKTRIRLGMDKLRKAWWTDPLETPERRREGKE